MNIAALLLAGLAFVFSFISLFMGFLSFAVVKRQEELGLTKTKEDDIIERAALGATKRIVDEINKRRIQAQEDAEKLLTQLRNLRKTTEQELKDDSNMH